MEIIKILIENGTLINNNNTTPLYNAIHNMNFNPNVIELFIQNDADIELFKGMILTEILFF